MTIKEAFEAWWREHKLPRKLKATYRAAFCSGAIYETDKVSKLLEKFPRGERGDRK